MKHVLVICSLFPPAGGPGAKRISQFVKYLIDFSWNPIVLTHKNYFLGIDKHSSQKIPSSVRVYRTRSLEQYIRKVPSKSIESNVQDTFSSNKKISLKFFIKKFFKNFAPDTAILWMPFALWSSKKIYIKTPFNAIFATGSSFSNFLIGLIISKITKKPLILDFRDAWAANPDLINGTKIQSSMARLYEKIAVCGAKYVIANTKGVRQDFLSRYPKHCKSKFVVIPNGFDEDDIITDYNSILNLDKSKFNIVHTGSLGGLRNPKLFLEAISELIQGNKLEKEKVIIHFVGNASAFIDGCYLTDYIQNYNLSQFINTTGFVSRGDAFRYNHEADLLLLIIGVTPKKMLKTYGLSGKVYDYILSNKPILALSQKGGATYNFLQENKIGIIAEPTDKKDIKEKIMMFYNEWEKGQLISNYNLSKLVRYNMRYLTQYLSNILNSSVQNM